MFKPTLIIFTLLFSVSIFAFSIDPKNENYCENCFLKNYSQNKVTTIDKLNFSILSEDESIKLFNYLKSFTEIPFRYVKDGCYARSYVLGWAMKQMGLKSNKIFSIGFLDAKNRYKQVAPVIHWGYHVANVVAVQNKQDQIEYKVIDISLFDSPVSIEKWKSAQLQTKKSKIKKVLIRPLNNYRFTDVKYNNRPKREKGDLKNAWGFLRSFKKQL